MKPVGWKAVLAGVKSSVKSSVESSVASEAGGDGQGVVCGEHDLSRPTPHTFPSLTLFRGGGRELSGGVQLLPQGERLLLALTLPALLRYPLSLMCLPRTATVPLHLAVLQYYSVAQSGGCTQYTQLLHRKHSSCTGNTAPALEP